MISKEDVEKVAKLARIKLTEAEIEKFQKELSSILDYFTVIEKVDVSDVEPMTHSMVLENIARQDIAKEKHSDKLVAMAPSRRERFFKIKSIL
jgi:aspartyl-tRNA(Asn)/glutamyl-tRNA(Gln) amidotransferase subunit C